MESLKQLEIIEGMLKESRKSLHRNSFYFLLWGGLMIPAGIIESYLFGASNLWLVWPVAGIVGGIITGIYSSKESKKAEGVKTAADRISAYTWGAFGFAMLFSIFYSLSNGLLPHALILLLAGAATFISGGISKFRPFVIGGGVLVTAAIICAFAVEPANQGYLFALGLFLGYILPGIQLRKQEYGQA